MAFDIKTRAGFTLVEIIISAGLLTMLMSGAFMLFRSGSRSFTQGSWRSQEQKNAQIFMAELERELGQASPRMVRVRSDGTNTSDLDTPIREYQGMLNRPFPPAFLNALQEAIGVPGILAPFRLRTADYSLSGSGGLVSFPGILLQKVLSLFPGGSLMVGYSEQEERTAC